MTETPKPRTFTIRHPGQRLVATVRWLQKAVMRDRGRPALQNISRHGSALVACDGFRLHAIEVAPSEWPDARMVFPDYVPSSGAGPLILVEQLPETIVRYPDFTGVMPNDAPLMELSVNATLLRDALEGMRSLAGAFQPIRLRFYGKDKPIEILGDGIYVLLMPTYSDGGDRSWRPTFEPSSPVPDAVPLSHNEPEVPA